MTPASSGYRLAAILLGLLAFALAEFAHAQNVSIQQSKIEAAMTLQILSFTEWPADSGEVGATIDIGVFEDATYLAAFESLLEDPRFSGRFTAQLVTSSYSNLQLDEIDALFFSKPDLVEIPRAILRLEGRPIALVGAFDGFLDLGGMVNLIKRQRRLAFEIDLEASRSRGIEYRAKLLRLAARVIE